MPPSVCSWPKRTKKELGLEAKMELDRDSGGLIPSSTSWSSSGVQNWPNIAGIHLFADFSLIWRWHSFIQFPSIPKCLLYASHCLRFCGPNCGSRG